VLPRVWLVPYLKGWSYDHTALAIAKHLAHRFEFRIAYQTDVDEGILETWPADLLIDFWWNGKVHERFPGRVLKQVSSHRWSMLAWGRLKPIDLLNRHCHYVAGVMVPSHRLLAELGDASRSAERHRRVMLGPKGYEPSQLESYRTHRGDLVVGWAGNAKGKDKRVPRLLEAEPSAVIADQCLTRDEMCDFYNSLDVIAIPSDAEGDPRTLIEGMACGCFPVATDVGIVPELVRNGENGLIIERTLEGLRDGFAWCRRNLEFIRAAGRRNAEQMRSSRTWAHVMPAWGDAIEQSLTLCSPMAFTKKEPARVLGSASQKDPSDLRARILQQRIHDEQENARLVKETRTKLAERRRR